MADLRDGMFFRIEKGQKIDVAIISGSNKTVFAYKAIYLNKDYSSFIPYDLLVEAFDRKLFIIYKNNNFQLAPADFEDLPLLPDIIDLSFLNNCYVYKPKNLFMSKLKWKLLIRNLLKGKNIMLVGSTGSGKTFASKISAQVLKRPFFMFRVGAMQDPRSSLIGNTFYNKEKGTYFKPSQFIKAIQIPNAVIVLDELSRAHPEAHNILLSVLDPEQKCISLDESDVENGEDSIIKVANGVSFVATANIGTEYTGTRQIDRANVDRFQYIEIDMLNEEEELELAILRFPNCDPILLAFLVKISANIKKEYLSDNANISNMMSTRMMLEAAELLDDGFTIGEALEATIIPLFDAKGGASSERTFLKNIISKVVGKGNQTSNNKNNDRNISEKNPFNAKK